MEYVRINLEPPDEFVPTNLFVEAKARWFFAGTTSEELSNLLAGCELSSKQREELLKPAAWLIQTNGVEVAPSDDLVLSLGKDARAQIYTALASSERNEYQFWPFKFRNGGFDDWFAESGLSEGTLALLRQLAYTRGTTLCFSDYSLVMSRIGSMQERRRFMKTLGRTSALLMKLCIRPDSDTRALADYWAKGWRAKDIQTLLESLTRVEGSISVDVAHLLPPFARKRLNTFPPPSSSPTFVPLNCFWTAFNFFNDPPDDKYLDNGVWKDELEREYTRVTEPAFGDLVFLVRADGAPVHSAVYIADDVVFTKNGFAGRQPWILMKWDDMIAGFPASQSLSVMIFHPSRPME